MRSVINIRYAQFRECDVSNGEGVGVALFVQGCNFHCHNCFNKNTWDFNGGKEWTPEVEDKFIELASRPYIKRISLLGGECLADENLDGVLNLVNKIRLLLPSKTIWLYSGYTFEECQPFSEDSILKPNDFAPSLQKILKKRWEIIKSVDVLVDGRYIDSQRNPFKKWAGSDNQRVISIPESLKQNKIVLYCD